MSGHAARAKRLPVRGLQKRCPDGKEPGAATSRNAQGLTLQEGALVGEYASSQTGDSPVARRSGALFREAKKRVAEFRHSQAIDINEEYTKHEKFSLSASISFRPLVACRFFRRTKLSGSM